MIAKKKYVITLTEDERQQLEKIRDRHKKPYMRERCVAILKIAEGFSPHYVAKHCLLKERDPDTVYGWVKSYQQHGISGLSRKTYHRCSLSDERKQKLEEMLHRPPHLFGQVGNRWTLEKVKDAFDKFASYTLSGIWRLLKRLKLSYKRGRLHITSPDIRYNEKKEWILKAKDDAKADSAEVVTLLGDVLLAAHRAGITLIPLPTYAPWENPIEKLWRWLCQEVLHMHDCADAWRTLWERVEQFLKQFEKGSLELLQYVGLLPKN